MFGFASNYSDIANNESGKHPNTPNMRKMVDLTKLLGGKNVLAQLWRTIAP